MNTITTAVQIAIEYLESKGKTDTTARMYQQAQDIYNAYPIIDAHTLAGAILGGATGRMTPTEIKQAAETFWYW